MLPGSYVEPAPAKVNLGLAVLTRRGDGFHELETVMALTDLQDEVRVEVAPGAVVRSEVGLLIEADDARGPVPGWDALAQGDDNLMVAAARAYLDAYLAAQRERHRDAAGQAGDPSSQPEPPAVSLTLLKRVPVAAGLGGGSSDAAAVLRALSRADAASRPDSRPLVDPGTLAEVALQLGSDVPFFLSGLPAAQARGRGERLTPLTLPRLDLVLVNPGEPVSAAEAYASLVGFTPRLRTERALARIREGLDPGWSNGLQPGVLRARPQLREVLTALREAGLKGVLMSGSGPTCFGLAPDAERAVAVAEELAHAHPAWWVSAAAVGAS